MLLSNNLDNQNAISPTILTFGNSPGLPALTTANQITAVNGTPNTTTTHKCPKTDSDNSAPDKVSRELLSATDSKFIRELNECIVCHLCKGYLIDATTIIECLHSFCKVCILKYLSDDSQKSRFCPKCDVQIHKTKPKLNIRSDPTLQDIVYKLVPGLFKGEMSRRKEFYSNQPEKALGLSNEEKGEINGERLILSNDDNIQLTIEYFPEVTNPYKLLPFKNDINKESSIDVNNKRRFLLCKAGMKVIHLKKFIRYKYDLDNNNKTQVEFFYKQELLKDDYTIMDLAYIYAWRKNIPIPLYYLIIEPDKNKEDYIWLFSQSKISPIVSNKKPQRKRHLKMPFNNSDKTNKKIHLVDSKDLHKNSSPKVVTSNVCSVTNKINNSFPISKNVANNKDKQSLSDTEQENSLLKKNNNSNCQNTIINNFTEDDSSTDISETSYQIDAESIQEGSNDNENNNENAIDKLKTNNVDIALQNDIQTSDITSTSDNSNTNNEKDSSDTGSKVIEICSKLIQKVEELQQNNLDNEKKDTAATVNINSPLNQSNTNIKNSITTCNKTELKEIKLPPLEEKRENCNDTTLKLAFKHEPPPTDDKEISNQNLDTTNQCLNPLKPELKLINIKTPENATLESNKLDCVAKSINPPSSNLSNSETNIQSSLLSSILLANLANTNDFKKLLYSQNKNSNSQNSLNVNLDVKLNSIKPLNLK